VEKGESLEIVFGKGCCSSKGKPYAKKGGSSNLRSRDGSEGSGFW